MGTRLDIRRAIPPLITLAAALLALSPTTAWGAAAALCRIGGIVTNAEDSTPIAGAKVTCLDRMEVTDSEGRYCFTDLPSLHPAELQLSVMNEDNVTVKCLKVTVEAPFLPLAVVKGDRFLVQIINPAEEAQVNLSVPSLTPEESCNRCLDCHPWNPCFEGATLEELKKALRHLPGIFVCEPDLEAYLARLQTHALEPDSYRVLRYADTHSQPFDVSSTAAGDSDHYRTPRNLALQEGKTTCDTCHSRHIPTGNSDYLLLPVGKGSGSALCKECHR